MAKILLKILLGLMSIAVTISAVIYLPPLFDDNAVNTAEKTKSIAVSSFPDEQASIYGRFLAGRFAERRSDLQLAALVMGQVQKEEPKNELFLRQAFVLAVIAGHNKKAFELAHQMNGRPSYDTTARVVQVASDFKNNDYIAALGRFADTQDSGLDLYVSALARAWSFVGQKKFVEARKTLTVIGREKGNSIYRFNTALIYYLAGDLDEAYSQLKKVNKDSNLLTAPLRFQRAAIPILQKLGRKNEALKIIDQHKGSNDENHIFLGLREAIENDKQISSLVETPSHGLAEGLFSLASALPRGRAGNLVLLYTRLAVMLKPKFPLAEILIGDILMSRNRFKDAVHNYSKVNPYSEYGWTAQLRKADALYEDGRIDEAQVLLEQMGTQKPLRLDALHRLGNYLRFKERYSEAVEVYNRVFARLKEPKKKDWDLFYARGIALERSKKWDRAEKDFLKALELMPDQPYVQNYLGYSWVERRQNLDRAKKLIESAVSQRQNDGYIIDSMGWVLYRLGEFDKAVPHLEKAVQIRPHDPIINNHLGDAYWRVGRKKEARFQWRRALSFKPDKVEREKIFVKLRTGLGKPEILGANQ